MSSRRQEGLRFLVLGATLSTGNMGVSALAAGAVTSILAQYPDATVQFLDYAAESSLQSVLWNGRRIRVPLVNIRFSKKFYLPNNIALLLLLAFMARVLSIVRLRDWVVSRNRCLSILEESQFCLSLAGGDSFSDIYGVARFLYCALPQLLVLLMQKPLILLPQTVGPFQHRASLTLAKYIIKRADRVYLRERRGLSELRRLAGSDDQKCAFSYDVGFLLEPIAPDQLTPKGAPLDTDALIVGLNISGLLLIGGYNQSNMFRLTVDYKELVVGIIDWLVMEAGATVVLIPHVFGSSMESDSTACNNVFAELNEKYLGHLSLIAEDVTAEQIKYIVGKCDFFIGSRMHACIAAISQSVPAVALAYGDKFIGVMETVGPGSVVADARQLTKDQILDIIKDAFANRSSLSASLARAMPEIKRSASQVLRDLPCVTSATAASTLEMDRPPTSCSTF